MNELKKFGCIRGFVSLIFICLALSGMTLAQSLFGQIAQDDDYLVGSLEGDSGLVSQLRSAEAELDVLKLKINHLEDTVLDRINEFTRQAQAQAVCRAITPGHWSFAVERSCDGSKTCRQICSSLVESQAGKLRCINSLHIYNNAPSSKTGDLGLKTYRYDDGCDAPSCGPNFCCCVGSG